MSTIAFIGLGNMGRPMVGYLLKAGHQLRIYARRPEVFQNEADLHLLAVEPLQLFALLLLLVVIEVSLCAQVVDRVLEVTLLAQPLVLLADHLLRLLVELLHCLLQTVVELVLAEVQVELVDFSDDTLFLVLTSCLLVELLEVVHRLVGVLVNFYLIFDPRADSVDLGVVVEPLINQQDAAKVVLVSYQPTDGLVQRSRRLLRVPGLA